MTPDPGQPAAAGAWAAAERVVADSPIGHLLLTPDLVICGANDAYLRATGRTRTQLVGRPVFEAFPADEGSAHRDGMLALQASFARVVESGLSDTLPTSRYDVAADPEDPASPMLERWWTLVTSPVRDESGRLVMLLHRVEDVTELRGAGQSDGQGIQLRHAQRETQRMLEQMAIGYIALDQDFRFSFLNLEGERLLGLPRADALGRTMWELFPDSQHSAFGQLYRQVMATRAAGTVEAFSNRLGVWFEVRAVPREGGIGLYVLDVTSRVLAQHSLERTADRLALLAEVSACLARTLDIDEAMRELATTVVPELCDWCIITVDGEQGLRDVAAVHWSRDEQPLLQDYVEAQVASMSDSAPILRVMATGEPVIAPKIRPEVLEQVFPDPAKRALLERLEPTSGIAVPIRTPDHTLGVLALWNGPGREAHDEQDIDTALEIGRRAGLLIENATLYAAQRRLAEALQRSLLTEPVQPDGLYIAVRYNPAAQEAQVGGDWYDAFRTADGSTCLVIGDVAGHDGEAAAAMGQVRNVLRGLAYTLPQTPGEVLTSLDHALHDLAVTAMATAVLCRVDPASGRLRWSNAGHPPPVLVTPDGKVRLLATDADLLLGLDSSLPRADHEVVLEPGSTVLLYTDGLVERRRASIDDGLSWLVDAMTDLAALPLEELLDALLDRIGSSSEDDVALLGLRVDEGCRPRGEQPHE